LNTKVEGGTEMWEREKVEDKRKMVSIL